VLTLTRWLLDNNPIPEVNELTECLWETGVSATILSTSATSSLLKGQSMNTFLHTAKDFTLAITAPQMACVISDGFPRQYTNAIQIALELTSLTKKLDSVSTKWLE